MLKSKWLLSLFSTLITLCIAEGVITFFYDFPDGYYVASPETSFVWKTDSLLSAGISEDSFVEFNDIGARTISDRKSKKKGIIAVGGSTTACYTLDQKKMWTALLENKLGNDYWVGNFGKPGSFSGHHVLQLEKILQYPDLPEIEKVVVMMGKNDISASLIDQQRYISLDEFALQINAFKHMPDSAIPWYRGLSIAKLYKNAKHNLIRMRRRKTHGEELLESQKQRLKTREVDQLPDLSQALAHYEKNALKIIEVAKRNEVELVFVSQAVLWSHDLADKDRQLICSHVPDKNIHYSAEALAEGMDAFNQKLEEICRREEVDFIWNRVPSDSDHFFDDCHYTNAGAVVTAENVFNGLRTAGIN